MSRPFALALGLILAIALPAAAQSPAGKLPGGDKPPTAQQIEHQAQQCYTAKIALLLYQVFLADEAVPADVKAAARRRLPFWEDAAGNDLVRLGKKWVTRVDAQKAHDDAEIVIDDSLELLRVNNYDLARNRLQQASDTDPNSARADYLMGLVYARVGRNFTKAQAHFNECVNREPDNVCALNNLALVEVFLGRYKDALKHFEAAVAISPGIPEIGHNLGRVLDQAGKGRMVIPPAVRVGYGDLYTTVLKQQGTPVQKEVHWLYMVPLVNADIKTQDAADTVVTGGGTGFVVHPHFVLTNRDVVGRARSFLIDDPANAEETKLPATLAAINEECGLALLRCENLKAPPIILSTERLSDPRDVLLLSFPEYTILSSNLASLRARFIPFGARSHAALMLSDEVGKPGKGGGPVCDNRGEVVALQNAYYDSRYKRATAVPIALALPFIQEQIDGFKPRLSNRDMLDWAQVHAKARQSTVHILRQEWKNDKLEMDGNVHTDWVEDQMCIACLGGGGIKCPNSSCKQGAIKVQRPVYQGKHPVTGGREEYQMQWFPEPCPTCKGIGKVACPFCKDKKKSHGVTMGTGISKD